VSNQIGKAFVVTSFGESHGKLIGAIVDGCPAGMSLSSEDIQMDLDRRRAEGDLSTPRHEEDKAEILSGVFNGHTTGAPICMVIWNRDTDSTEYERLHHLPRPGRADYTAYVKYGGFSDYRGGGEFSGRITASFVMAGAVARKVIALSGIEVLAHTVEIGGIPARKVSYQEIKERVAKSEVGCADPEASELMAGAIRKARDEGDSLGGVVEVVALNVPPGVGEPIFDTLEGELSKAFFAIPAVKGVEFGAGFAAAKMKGSENNDPFSVEGGKITSPTNNSGGILGGISSGRPIIARLAFKPTPSIRKPQKTVNLKKMSEEEIVIGGRHDPCFVPRVVVSVEAMMCIVLADLGLRGGQIPRVNR